MYNHNPNYYHEMQGYNYLKPSKTVMKKAYKTLLKEYKRFVKNKEKGTYQLYYQHITIKNKAVIAHEFVLHMNNTKQYKPETADFELTVAFDFKRDKGLFSEKKQFTQIAGYIYKPNYHYLVYPFTWEKHSGASFKNNAIENRTKAYTNIKINKYFTLEIGELKSYYNFRIIQQILNKNPEETEFLFKRGYHHLLDKKISKEKMEILRKNNLGNILPEKLNDLNVLHKKFKKKITISETIKYLNVLSKNFLIPQEMNEESIKRTYNLDRNWNKIKDFKKACNRLRLDFNTEILQNQKRRETILNEYNLILEEEEQRYFRANIKANLAKVEKITTKTKQSLEQITKEFKELHINNIVFKPLKNMTDFINISNTLNLCLIRNDYYKSVQEGKAIIYAALPENAELKHAEIIEWNIKKNTISLNQINGFNNKKTENHDTIKQIATGITKEMILSV